MQKYRLKIAGDVLPNSRLTRQSGLQAGFLRNSFSSREKSCLP
jgi:hypothetical protein